MNDIGIIWLTRGAFTIVDIEDYEWLNQWKWNLSWKGYAVRQIRNKDGKIEAVMMHRLINHTPKHLQTDHINIYKFDNRKQNLRNSTNGQNAINSSKRRGVYSSKYKGVYWSKNDKKWVTQVKFNGKRYTAKFDSELEAAKDYNKFAIEMQGEFARINEL